MQFIDLYNRIIELWPYEIDISDGYPTGSNGFMFTTLSQTHSKIEESIDYKNDHWGNIAVWSFFQAFHEKAKEVLKAGGKVINTRQIEKELIDRKIQNNLQANEWSKEKSQYVAFVSC